MDELFKIRSKRLCEVNCPHEISFMPNMPKVGSASCSLCKFNGGVYVHRLHKEANYHEYYVHNELDGVYVVCYNNAHNHKRMLLTEKFDKFFK